MTLWSPTVDDLADFTGQVGASYEEFVTQALAQSVLLFEWASCIDTLPAADTKEGALIRNAILAMADALYLGKDYREARSTPFQSENIGSYSYSKAQNAVTTGIPTGVGWFDMAIEFLGVCVRSKNSVMGSSKILFEDDVYWHTHSDGKIHLLGPEDLKGMTPPAWWSVPQSYTPDQAMRG